MDVRPKSDIRNVIGNMPYRMAFAGGWIDQPFLSSLNPDPFGSMVVAAIEPNCRFMDRCGMSTSTRKVAQKLWPDGIPAGNPYDLTKQLYNEENKDRPEPSGAQDMIGLIYPGISRLDFDIRHDGGYFPRNIESCNDRRTADWLETVIYMLPVCPRPDGYNPLGEKNFDPEWVRRLGRTGIDCYDSILNHDAVKLGRSMNDCMQCWETLLPQTVSHPVLTVDLKAVLRYYQERYAGAMYSGCGGGYLYVVAEEPVPGGFQVSIITR